VKRFANTLAAASAVGLCALVACVSEEDPADRVAGSYSFAVVGDMPYYADPDTQLAPEFVAAQYAAVLQEIDEADVEFVVHVGDTNSSRYCRRETVLPTYRLTISREAQIT